MQSLKKIHAWAQMKVPLSEFIDSGPQLENVKKNPCTYIIVLAE